MIELYGTNETFQFRILCTNHLKAGPLPKNLHVLNSSMTNHITAKMLQTNIGMIS